MKSIKPFFFVCLLFITGCLTTTPSPKPAPEPAPTPPPAFPTLPVSAPSVRVAPHPLGVILSVNTAQVIGTPATSIKLSWTEPAGGANFTGFKIYYGPSSGNYTNVVITGLVNEFTFVGVVSQKAPTYFVVTSVGPGGESLPSNEVNYTVPILPPAPVSWAVNVDGTEWDVSDGAYWQLNPADQLSTYTNGNACSIVWQAPNWNLTLTNNSVIYSSTNIVNTGWVPVNGSNYVVTTAIGNPQGAPLPPGVANSSLMIYWGMPTYNVYVSSDLNGSWSYLTNTADPYIFINPQLGGQREFFKIEPAITNVISKTIQN